MDVHERQFLLSEAYRQYLERVVRTVSGEYDLQVVFSDQIQTDGRVIQINPLSPLLASLPTLEQKTLAILGQLAHEYFHIAYTDFRAFRLLPAKMREETPFRREMAYRLLNIIEDAAVEREGCEAYRGLFRRAVFFSNHVAFSQMPGIDEMQRRGAPSFQVLSQATLMQAILGRVKGHWRDERLAAVFEEALPILAQGREAADSMARLRHAEALYRLYLPWIEEMERQGAVADHSFQYVKPVFRYEEGTGGLRSVRITESGRMISEDSRVWESGRGAERGNGIGTGPNAESGRHAQEAQEEAGGTREADGWRWDEDVGHPSAAGKAAQLPGREAPEAQEPRSEASLQEDQSRLSNRQGGTRREKSSVPRLKWFRLGRRKRNAAAEARHVVDAEEVRAAATGEGEKAMAPLADRSAPAADAEVAGASPGADHGAATAGPAAAAGHQSGQEHQSGAEKDAAPFPASGTVPDDAGAGEWAPVLKDLAKALGSVQAAARREREAGEKSRSLARDAAYRAERLATGVHQGIRLFANRDFVLGQEEAARFAQLEAESRWLVQSMARQWQHWLLGGQPVRQTGLYSGKLDEQRLWRRDTRLFYRRTEDEAANELAILVLVDESGSMQEAERWRHAQRACLLLEAVCRACRLPFAVIGHLAVYGQPHVVHHHYLDFGPRPVSQRQRLVLLGPKENTREGLSLRYAGEYIRQARQAGRLGDPERVRPVLLSFSDGQPVHDVEGWTLKVTAAQEDARAAVRELEKDGIQVIGVAIGEEPSAIGQIYPHALEVRRLEDLPQRLIRKLRQLADTNG